MTQFFHLLAESYNNIISITLMMVGFYIVVMSSNLVKKLIGLAIFQTSVLLIYISAAYVKDARFPILQEGVERYINPLPHVLMLTAIVVGIATLAVGLAIVVRIKGAYGTCEEDEILALDREATHGSIQEDKRKESTVTDNQHHKIRSVGIRHDDKKKPPMSTTKKVAKKKPGGKSKKNSGKK